MRQHFGLRLGGLREALGQHLGNALVVLLPGAPQQRLVGRVLNQGVLEGVGRLGREPRCTTTSAVTSCTSAPWRVAASRGATACTTS